MGTGAKPARSIASAPFYRERTGPDGAVEPWTLDDLEDFARTRGDAFGGRVAAGAETPVALQIEATSEPPVWTALDARELGAWAGGLAGIWRRWGTSPGETIAFFDYGSSPLVLLASASYVARLRRGAADRLGLTAVCNDGVAAMAGRMVTIVESVAPAAIVIRRDLLTPFADALRSSGVELRGGVRWVGVTDPEGAPARREAARAAEEWGVAVSRILRADAAHLLAGDCAACGLFHLDPRLYRTERTAGGTVVVTNRFTRLCPTVRYDLGPCATAPAGCPAEPDAPRIEWD